MIPALLLAAGSGRRMGGPKALLILGGETLLDRMIRIAATAGFGPLVVVVSDWYQEAADPRPDLLVVRNPHAAEGMAGSLRAGLSVLPPEATAVLILTLDQPAVDGDLLRRLQTLAMTQLDQPVACAYAGTLGVPAILPRRLFPELMALEGDQGAKAILLRQGAAALPFPEGEDDLDTPEDLARFTR